MIVMEDVFCFRAKREWQKLHFIYSIYENIIVYLLYTKSMLMRGRMELIK